MFEHILSVIIFLPIIAGLLLLATPASRNVARFTGLVISLSTLVLSLDLYGRFQSTGHRSLHQEQIGIVASAFGGEDKVDHRQQHRGGHEDEEADAIHTQGVRNPKRWNPAQLLNKF